jgi:2-keto-3-deoxy-galactonokinase
VLEGLEEEGMFRVSHKNVARMLERSLVAALLATGLALVMVPVAKAGQIIPSMGWTKMPDSYHKADIFNGQVEQTQWPVTASLWVKPMPMFYVGGGLGWYNTTLHYPNTPALASYTSQKTGVHLGGGLTLPLVPGVASADLNLRYVYLGEQKSDLPPQNFKADYWTTSLGVAFHF